MTADEGASGTQRERHGYLGGAMIAGPGGAWGWQEKN